MISQTPAQGIMKTNDWGDSKTYRVACDCSDPGHDHNVWIEADDVGVNVNVYVDVKSPFWARNRWQQIWTLMTKGYLQHESTITMNEQQALNYAETIKSAIQDVKNFKKP